MMGPTLFDYVIAGVLFGTGIGATVLAYLLERRDGSERHTNATNI